MTERFFMCLRLAIFTLAIQVTFAQKCYYPNGSEAPEKPCSSAEGSACCPDQWECLDNGLCHYGATNLWGRYSCTDQSWKSPGCPSNLCTYNLQGVGGESITQCKDHDDQWCCNADNQHVNCCKESPSPRPFFDLPEGKAYATVGASTASDAPNLATITGMAEATSGGGASSTRTPSSDPPKSSDAPKSSNDASVNSAQTTDPTTPVTSLQTRVSSGSAGIVTLVVTSVVQPPASSTSSPTPASPSSSNSKLPVIVGCAVGIPLGLALIGILIWLFRKRQQQKNPKPYPGTPDLYANGSTSPDFAGGAKLTKNNDRIYKSESDIPELAGQSVGPGRPVSTIKGRAELDSGAGFVPGAAPPHAPHLVGLGGGNGNGTAMHTVYTPQNSWGSAPPGYSPGMNHNAWAPGHGQANSVGSTGMGQDNGAGNGNGAVATETGGYIPYRPPPGHGQTQTQGQGHHLSNVPEMPELNSVQTPPAAELSSLPTPPAAELNTVRTPPA